MSKLMVDWFDSEFRGGGDSQRTRHQSQQYWRKKA